MTASLIPKMIMCSNVPSLNARMRDSQQPQVSLGDEIQLNIIEMKKADRLGLGAE
jgi:hypothetical protein